MISVAEIDAMVESGVSIQTLAAVFKTTVTEFEIKTKMASESSDGQPQKTLRQARNSRYYKTRKDRLNESKDIYNNITLPEGERVQGEREPKMSHILDQFKLFWEIFPRRQAKGGALRAFGSAVRRAKAEEILAGAKRYAAERKGQDRKFTCLPTTWLNQDRWADEADKPEQTFTVGSGPKRTWAEIKAEKAAQSADGKIVMFPGVRIERAPVEGEDLDALVRRDDQGSQGTPGQEEPGSAGVRDVLPALQAMDNTEKD